ncbi:MAG: tyrosine-type recombinase/integrase [Bryobacteraceae bacterium]|jgi:integrase
MTAYGADLRVSEVVSLQVGDIDSQRKLIRIRQSKGKLSKGEIPGLPRFGYPIVDVRDLAD